jgi:hypothetical protein
VGRVAELGSLASYALTLQPLELLADCARGVFRIRWGARPVRQPFANSCNDYWGVLSLSTLVRSRDARVRVVSEVPASGSSIGTSFPVLRMRWLCLYLFRRHCAAPLHDPARGGGCPIHAYRFWTRDLHWNGDIS